MSAPVARVGGRLLLVDPDHRVLLIHERLEAGGSHWLTPGGGVELDEVPAQAAVREAAEEIGFDAVLPDGVEPVHRTRRLWSWGPTVFDQVDHFYLLRVDAAFEPRPRQLTEPERLTLLGHRWWTLEDLRVTAEIVVPPDLPAVLGPLLGERGPAA